MCQDIDKSIVHALIQVFLLLEFSDENLLDADYAVKMNENICFILKKSNESTLLWLRDAFDECAKDYDEEKAQFIREIFENMGIGDELDSE